MLTSKASRNTGRPPFPIHHIGTSVCLRYDDGACNGTLASGRLRRGTAKYSESNFCRRKLFAQNFGEIQQNFAGHTARIISLHPLTFFMNSTRILFEQYPLFQHEGSGTHKIKFISFNRPSLLSLFICH